MRILLCLLLTLPFYLIHAQVPEPEFVGNVLMMQDDQGIPLEKQRASNNAKAGASMYVVGAGKVKASNVVDGLNSPVRVASPENPSFVIRVADNNVDPFMQINIFRLERNEKKGFRYIEVGSSATFKGSSSMDIDFLPFQASKYGTGSYLVTLENNPDPGEYAITLEGSRDIFHMFGVD